MIPVFEWVVHHGGVYYNKWAMEEFHMGNALFSLNNAFQLGRFYQFTTKHIYSASETFILHIHFFFLLNLLGHYATSERAHARIGRFFIKLNEKQYKLIFVYLEKSSSIVLLENYTFFTSGSRCKRSCNLLGCMGKVCST